MVMHVVINLCYENKDCVISNGIKMSFLTENLRTCVQTMKSTRIQQVREACLFSCGLFVNCELLGDTLGSLCA